MSEPLSHTVHASGSAGGGALFIEGGILLRPTPVYAWGALEITTRGGVNCNSRPLCVKLDLYRDLPFTHSLMLFVRGRNNRCSPPCGYFENLPSKITSFQRNPAPCQSSSPWPLSHFLHLKLTKTEQIKHDLLYLNT